MVAITGPIATFDVLPTKGGNLSDRQYMAALSCAWKRALLSQLGCGLRVPQLETWFGPLHQSHNPREGRSHGLEWLRGNTPINKCLPGRGADASAPLSLLGWRRSW